MSRKLVTVSAAANGASITRRTIQRWIKGGNLSKHNGKVDFADVLRLANIPQETGRPRGRHGVPGRSKTNNFKGPYGLSRLEQTIRALANHYISLGEEQALIDALTAGIKSVGDRKARLQAGFTRRHSYWRKLPRFDDGQIDRVFVNVTDNDRLTDAKKEEQIYFFDGVLKRLNAEVTAEFQAQPVKTEETFFKIYAKVAAKHHAAITSFR